MLGDEAIIDIGPDIPFPGLKLGGAHPVKKHALCFYTKRMGHKSKGKFSYGNDWTVGHDCTYARRRRPFV